VGVSGLSDFDLSIELDFVRRMPKLIVFALD